MSLTGSAPNGYMNNHRRGVYFSQLYNNTREFLRDEISEDQLIPNPKCDHTKVVDWWKGKAIGRYRSLKKGNKLEKTTLWYENVNQDLVETWLSSRGVRNIPQDRPVEKSVTG